MTLLKRLAASASVLSLAACATGAWSPPAPREAETYADHLVGRVANLRQDHAAAADRYFQALSREPNNAALIEGAVTASLASGDLDRARQAARMAPRQGAPGYVQLLRAADDLARGRTRIAGDELNAIEGNAAEGLIGRMMLVWVQAGDGNVDGVIADLTPLASIRPYGGLFTYQQAMALDFAGRNAEALEAYADAANGPMFLPPGVEQHADLLVRSGAAQQAVTLLQSEQNRSNPALTVAAQRAANNERIVPQLTPARGAAVALYGLAAIYDQENDATNALATLSLSLSLDPQLDASRIMFAQIQGKLGHPDLARTMLQRVAAPSPYAASARMMEAWLYVDADRPDEALAIARVAAEGGDLRAKRTLADIYRNLRRYNDAEPIYSQLIEAQPNEWRLFFARGAARERLGRWPEAEADFQHALQLSPEQPDVMNYLGYTWIDRGEHMQEGLAMLQRAVALRPMSGAIIDSLGWAYFRMGDYPQALSYIERAVELEPSDAILNEHLGDVYWRLGRRIEARFQWQRALSFEANNADAIQAKVENGLPDLPPSQSATR